MSALVTYPEPLVNRWSDTSKITWDKILQHGVGGGGASDVPVIDAQGRIALQADDGTWHYVYLFSDEGVRLEVEQAPTADPGTRGYFIWTADDATKHRTDLFLDEGSYTINIDQSASAAASDYTTLALAISPAFTVFHNVTLVLDETYTEAVNQTPNP